MKIDNNFIKINGNQNVGNVKKSADQIKKTDNSAFLDKLDGKIAENSDVKRNNHIPNNLNNANFVKNFVIKPNSNTSYKEAVNNPEFSKVINENSKKISDSIDPIRQEKVQLLKEKIQNGEYSINLEGLAQNLIKRNIFE